MTDRLKIDLPFDDALRAAPDCGRLNAPSAVFCRSCASMLGDDREPLVVRPGAVITPERAD